MENDLTPEAWERMHFNNNIFDSSQWRHSAAGWRNILCHAGFKYDHNPRPENCLDNACSKRAARGLGSLYAHANQIRMEQAGEIHMNYTLEGEWNEPWIYSYWSNICI